MRKFILSIAACCLLTLNSVAQTNPDSAVFLLHKFAQHIGQEKYRLNRTDSGTVYSIDFKFTDRGSAVPLTAVIELKTNLDPVRLSTRGRSSRFSVLNDTIEIRDQVANLKIENNRSQKALDAPVFTVAGYSPGTVQMLMLQYWKKQGRPKMLNILPAGQVQIKANGTDSFVFNGKPILLEQYVVKGLIWGNELIWTDQQGLLYCLITNDAEGDKLEMMLEPFETLLSQFISKAAVTSMQLFSNESGTASIQPRLVAIKGGTLIDVVNQQEIPNGVMVIENGVIKSISKEPNAKIPAGAHLIDATGKSIVPGLWDMHAHFEQAEWGPAYLAAGVTTVRDCGNEFEYINAVTGAINAGRGLGPHILRAGIIDGKGAYALGIVQVTKPQEAIDAVKRYKEYGYDQIKIYSSLSPAMVRVVCTEAHRLGLTVTGHIPEGMNIVAGIDSGMDMVNHISYVLQSMKVDKKTHLTNLDDSVNRRLFALLKEKGVVIDPTLNVYDMIFRDLKDSFSTIEPGFRYLPEPLQAMLSSTGMPSEQAASFKALMTTMAKTVKALRDAGVPVVAGTDMGAPGFSVYRELELYVQGGMKPGEALQAATIVPARVMHRDRNYGSLTVGKKADIILVGGNPLRQISDIRNVELVIKENNIYQPAELRRIAGFRAD